MPWGAPCRPALGPEGGAAPGLPQGCLVGRGLAELGWQWVDLCGFEM